MKNDTLTIRELQDAINRRLEQFDGRKYEAKKGTASPAFYRWYTSAIAETLEEYKISFFRPAAWRIVAEIDDAAPLNVSFVDVAAVAADIKTDRRYSYGGPGTVRSLRVHFRDDLLDLAIPAARVRLLEKEKAARIAYHREEREKALAAAEEAAAKITELEAVKITEAGT